MKRFIIIVIVSIYGCSLPTSTEEETILDGFERQLQEGLDDDDLNGAISIAIVKGDKVIRSKAFGKSNLKDLNADTSNIFRVGSISKSFTAFLLMRLVEDGTVSLDDLIENHVPEVKEMKGYSDSTKFTFRQLASHTSGLARLPKIRYQHGGIDEWESLLLEAIPLTNFTSKIGERYSYSNIGFGILGLAISRAANKSFIELMKTKVFEPLNMRNTFYHIPENKMKNWSHGRSGGPIGGYDDERPKKELVGRGWSVPNGGIWSTANDLSKFMVCNLGYSPILNVNNLSLMHSTQTPEGNWQNNYGLGFSIYQDNIIHTIGHQGGTPGYSANFLFEKESEYGVIILRNYNWGITNLNLRSTLLLRKLKLASESI